MMFQSPVLTYWLGFKEKMHVLITQHCRRKGACTVLDIGCGSGEDLYRVKQAFPQAFVCGMEFSFENLKRAQKINPGDLRGNFVQSHAEKLPFRQCSFDVVFSSEVLEHLTGLNSFLSEVRRVLKDDGVFIVTTPSRWNYVTLIGFLIPKKLKEKLRHWIYAIAPGSDPKPHVKEYLAIELRKIFDQQGFSVFKTDFGVMRVPAWRFFDRVPFLLALWRGLDKIIGCFPGGSNLKANFIMAAKKRLPAEERILVINLGGMGDLLLSQPALNALKSFYGQGLITMLVAHKSRDVAQSFEYADKIITLDIGYGGVASWQGMMRNFWKLLLLRRVRFTLAINMRTLVSGASAKKMQFMLRVIHPLVSAGRDTEGRGIFFDVRVPESDIGKMYERDYDIATVHALGVPVPDKAINLEVPVGARENISELMKKNGIGDGDCLIGLHPGGMPSRRWPIERYTQLISDINKQFCCKFVVTGGCDESSLAGFLKEKTQAPLIDMTGKLHFLELAALIQRCQLFISNDTGPMHVSAILRTPLLAILGPGDIVRFDPRNVSEKVKVLYKKAPCAPCNRQECQDMACLEAITSEEAYAAAAELLKKSQVRA
ncbi:MAG: methyltransferase domain-containing protein [Candidatus Omnitrophica bacterium]|nr:methyltransferase domain-containing protein [Candidatus Omnitrophota bacterium]